ncbi:MAG: NYN domain-containing protein [Gemmatimonadota bacterium]|nr:MAG: NYN domain-containing protein [Gemmatimonadota bacterium]
MRQDSPERRSDSRADVEDSLQAALLIDFDNVTMGIRSNLGQELRNLLNSDVIRGKVAVQRAYADWRRYPQYIVPLSEASIDLIFAPAYGSSKKNATDIRLAIDALELVFIRPEIRTFILMSGDSDFSSLVLKLKEYGKYVIGVGIQESSSDLLVQNCDEYYSYSSLSGLSRSGDQPLESHDPWVLVEKAIGKMVERGDTMRSDRLKQVMLEIDPSFNEKEQGFNKFNRFVVEAASQGLVSIQKMENGQYGVAPGEGGKPESAGVAKKREAKVERGGRRAREKVREAAEPGARATEEDRTRRARPKLTMKSALELLDRALGTLLEADDASVRDSDVKRRILEIDPAFDEGELGFSKFSKFLLAAAEEGAIELTRGPNGNYHVGRSKGSARRRKPRQPSAEPSAGEKGSTVKRLARLLFGTGPQEPADREAPAAAPKREPRAPERKRPEEPREARKGRGEPRGRQAAATRGAKGRRESRTGGGRAEGTSARGGRGRREERRPASRGGAERRTREEGRGPREPRKGHRAEERLARPPEPSAAEVDVEEAAVASAPLAAAPAVDVAVGGAAEHADRGVASPTREAGDESKRSAVAPAPLPGAPRGTIRGRWGTRGRYRPSQAPPPVFEGQKKPDSEPASAEADRVEQAAGGDTGAIVSRLTGYPGVGEKTAETLVEAFGAETLRILDEEPERVREVLPDRRAERVLEARREERKTGD